MNKKLKDILSNSLFFLIVIILSFLIIKFVGQRTVVIGPSMMTTLEDGDNMIIDKISYRFHDPERFDFYFTGPILAKGHILNTARPIISRLYTTPTLKRESSESLRLSPST